MMDPRQGKFYPLAQYPFFYPPDYQHFLMILLIEHTKVKAITDANEPGSVCKPFTVAVAFKANQQLVSAVKKNCFSTDEKIATGNGRFPGSRKPITDTSLHYYLDMDMAMQKSLNIYMGRIAE